MTTQTLFQARPYAGDADLTGVCDLINTCNQVDQLGDEPYAGPESTRAWFAEPNLDPAQDIRLWLEAGGRIVGLGMTRIEPQNAQDEEQGVDTRLYFRVHPDARNSGLEDSLLDWAESRVRAVARERGQPAHLRSGMHMTTPDYIAYRQGLLERLGFRPVRFSYKMARSLDLAVPAAEFPPGYSLRHVQNEADMIGWVDAFNGSFIDHWNYHPETVEQHKHWLENPTYQPEGDLIALAADGTIAAFCTCTIDAEDNANRGRDEGWIDTLGTRRGHRKIGLGRAMLLAGLHWLKGAGVATAVLGVDAENPTGALRLYESVGFTVQDTTYSYQKDL